MGPSSGKDGWVNCSNNPIYMIFDNLECSGFCGARGFTKQAKFTRYTVHNLAVHQKCWSLRCKRYAWISPMGFHISPIVESHFLSGYLLARLTSCPP
eukprot:6472735-Amphidinium_carterae.2